ncbi:MAG: hypothetical protein H6741_35555 [Alphaproteobacteria bacterium]|nr:hypothetical protein [Alphaproteobacteria bacterium]MCB9798025.1 hypothetical protein [Alphaproteobacteria bacterium]
MAAQTPICFTARLRDPSGRPLQGRHWLTVSLWRAPTSRDPQFLLWQDSFHVELPDSGLQRFVLHPSSNTGGPFSGEVWVGISKDGGATDLQPRVFLGASAFAVGAGDLELPWARRTNSNDRLVDIANAHEGGVARFTIGAPPSTQGPTAAPASPLVPHSPLRPSGGGVGTGPTAGGDEFDDPVLVPIAVHARSSLSFGRPGCFEVLADENPEPALVTSSTGSGAGLEVHAKGTGSGLVVQVSDGAAEGVVVDQRGHRSALCVAQHHPDAQEPALRVENRGAGAGLRITGHGAQGVGLDVRQHGGGPAVRAICDAGWAVEGRSGDRLGALGGPSAGVLGEVPAGQRGVSGVLARSSGEAPALLAMGSLAAQLLGELRVQGETSLNGGLLVRDVTRLGGALVAGGEAHFVDRVQMVGPVHARGELHVDGDVQLGARLSAGDLEVRADVLVNGLVNAGRHVTRTARRYTEWLTPGAWVACDPEHEKLPKNGIDVGWADDMYDRAGPIWYVGQVRPPPGARLIGATLRFTSVMNYDEGLRWVDEGLWPFSGRFAPHVDHELGLTGLRYLQRTWTAEGIQAKAPLVGDVWDPKGRGAIEERRFDVGLQGGAPLDTEAHSYHAELYVLGPCKVFEVGFHYLMPEPVGWAPN